MGHTINPFIVFPEEIWEAVLDHVEEDQDIVTVLSAFPELQILPEGKRCSWLFSTIIPFIFPKYLEFRKVKSCRMVSKRWKVAVNKCLETHPDRLPYTSKGGIGSINESHFSYSRLPCISTDFNKYVCKKFGPHSDGDILTNPFPGRYVHFSLIHTTDDNIYWEKQEKISTYPIALNFIGHNIRHIMIYGHQELSAVSTNAQHLYEYLSYLPNLKQLKLVRVHFREERLTRFLRFMATRTLPFRLETLDLVDIPMQYKISKQLFAQLMTTLVNHDEILHFGTTFSNWQSQFATLFPNMNELSVSVNSKDALRKILQDVSSPHLRKLRIKMDGLLISDILESLAPHEIESLQICGKLGNATFMDNFSASSLKRIGDSVTNYFALKFPSHTTGVSLVVGCHNSNLRSYFPSIFYLSLEATPEINFEYLKSLPLLQNLTIEYYQSSRSSKCCRSISRSDSERDMFRARLSAFYCNLYHKGRPNEPGNFKDIWYSDDYPS